MKRRRNLTLARNPDGSFVDPAFWPEIEMDVERFTKVQRSGDIAVTRDLTPIVLNVLRDHHISRQEQLRKFKAAVRHCFTAHPNRRVHDYMMSRPSDGTMDPDNKKNKIDEKITISASLFHIDAFVLNRILKDINDTYNRMIKGPWSLTKPPVLDEYAKVDEEADQDPNQEAMPRLEPNDDDEEEEKEEEKEEEEEALAAAEDETGENPPRLVNGRREENKARMPILYENEELGEPNRDQPDVGSAAVVFAPPFKFDEFKGFTGAAVDETASNEDRLHSLVEQVFAHVVDEKEQRYLEQMVQFLLEPSYNAEISSSYVRAKVMAYSALIKPYLHALGFNIQLVNYSDYVPPKKIKIRRFQRSELLDPLIELDSMTRFHRPGSGIEKLDDWEGKEEWEEEQRKEKEEWEMERIRRKEHFDKKNKRTYEEQTEERRLRKERDRERRVRELNPGTPERPLWAKPSPDEREEEKRKRRAELEAAYDSDDDSDDEEDEDEEDEDETESEEDEDEEEEETSSDECTDDEEPWWKKHQQRFNGQYDNEGEEHVREDEEEGQMMMMMRGGDDDDAEEHGLMIAEREDDDEDMADAPNDGEDMYAEEEGIVEEEAVLDDNIVSMEDEDEGRAALENSPHENEERGEEENQLQPIDGFVVLRKGEKRGKKEDEKESVSPDKKRRSGRLEKREEEKDEEDKSPSHKQKRGNGAKKIEDSPVSSVIVVTDEEDEGPSTSGRRGSPRKKQPQPGSVSIAAAAAAAASSRRSPRGLQQLPLHDPNQQQPKKKGPIPVITLSSSSSSSAASSIVSSSTSSTLTSTSTSTLSSTLSSPMASRAAAAAAAPSEDAASSSNELPDLQEDQQDQDIAGPSRRSQVSILQPIRDEQARAAERRRRKNKNKK